MNLDDRNALEKQLVDPGFLAHILERHRQQAVSLLAEAAFEWARKGYPRWDDREGSCAVALVGQLLDLLDRRRATALQPFVSLEAGVWSAEHLAGRADPSGVPRPDVVIWLGLEREARMNVECKRLVASDATPRMYVKEGMDRFWTGYYPVDSGVGTMVGFLLDREVTVASLQISEAIRAFLGLAEPLRENGPIGPLDPGFRSDHSSGVSVLHLLLDMTERQPPNHLGAG